MKKQAIRLSAGATAGTAALWLLDRLGRQSPFRERGGTAVITGASSGIGEAFAHQLAQEGYGLVLVARREERLAALAAGLEQRYGVPVEVVVADLAEPAGMERVAALLRGRDDVQLLINNAGFGVRGYFWELDLAPQEAMVNLHVQAMVHLCHAVLPGMVARGRGAIINVSSVTAFESMAHNTIYSATKATMVRFSESLAYALAGTGVQVQALCPGFTHTEFHDTAAYATFKRERIPAILWMSSAEVAGQSLAALRAGGPVVFIPGRFYRLIVMLLRPGLHRPLLRLAFRLRGRLKR